MNSAEAGPSSKKRKLFPEETPDDLAKDSHKEKGADGGDEAGDGDEDGDLNIDDYGGGEVLTGTDRERMSAILEKFTPEQMNRYEAFRRVKFAKAAVKRVMLNVLGPQSVNPQSVIVVSGLAKMFVGDVVEMSRVIMSEAGEEGPIRPSHMREALRRLKQAGKGAHHSPPKLFRRQVPW
eukprot:jgi/Mesvir1/12214/Mv00442-RA.1